MGTIQPSQNKEATLWGPINWDAFYHESSHKITITSVFFSNWSTFQKCFSKSILHSDSYMQEFQECLESGLLLQEFIKSSCYNVYHISLQGHRNNMTYAN